MITSCQNKPKPITESKKETKIEKPPETKKDLSIEKINECKIYKDIDKKFLATRYHSLYLNKNNFPQNLKITSISEDDKIIMSFKHELFSIYGVQYHPESIETLVGSKIIENFMDCI